LSLLKSSFRFMHTRKRIQNLNFKLRDFEWGGQRTELTSLVGERADFNAADTE
jgi:hypothetical protein